MATDTIQQLATLTDAAQFERIATSVLRSACPGLYANLSHQGVNTDGKTVKAPLDNSGWARINGEPMFVAGAHTTSSRDDLDKKWLHDPSAVKARNPSGKPTQPAGDLVKALGEIAKLRKQHPDLKATIALTCNREEPTKVRLAAESLAHSANVILDIWSVSRIAQHLDTTPEGQAIRFAYLGTQVTLLSKEELLRAGRLSLSTKYLPTDTGTLVSREGVFGGTGHILLSGASGMGKTTICIEILRNALAEDHPGIILHDQTVRTATSIEEAIDIELRRYLPQLEPFAGASALNLCTELNPFIVVVEDISRAENTLNLLNKLTSWALHGVSQSSGSVHRNWRLLCPVWPRFLAGLERAKEINNAGMVHYVGLYSEDDAQEAIKRRGEVSGYSQNDLSAAAIAHTLGRDPLLIGLYDFSSVAHAQEVIAQYVNREFDSVALSASMTTTDLAMAVDALMLQMLQRRCLNPTWREVQDWLGKGDDLKPLRALTAKGGILRLSGELERIEFRHDRVLHSLLAKFIASGMGSDLYPSYLSDPYFAEVVGTAASLATLAPSRLQKLMCDTPLVAFYAFKHAVQRGSDYADAAAQAIEGWICMESTRGPTFSTRRYRGLQILSEIDSPTVLELTSKFPQDDWHQPLLEARFRNGDLGAALRWLTEYPFEVEFAGRQELIDHVRSKYDRGLVRAVEKVLDDPKSTTRERLGALYLTGYLAEPTLAKAIRKVWLLTDPNARDLEAFLWAAARACGDEADTTLGPVCDAWEALPERDDAMDVESSRSSLAAHGISWKFRDHIPRTALPYFVQRAKQSEALKWPITYMMRCIDDPVAVQFEVEYLADRRRESEGTNGYVDHFLKDEWQRRTEKHGREMSRECKRHLLDLALNTNNDSYLRKAALSLWEVCVSAGDLEVARSIKVGNVLYDTAIWARVRRSDLTVIPELLEKIKENPSYWWQAGRYIWTDELTSALGVSLQELSKFQDERDSATAVWIFPELLLRLDLATAERLLLAAWPKVCRQRAFVQVALCLATPKFVELANDAISKAAEPNELLKHFSFTAGWKVAGRDGFTRQAQLEAVRPHLHLFSEIDIYHLWVVCNERNWQRFRKRNLDPILLAFQSPLSNRLMVEKTINMSELDAELAGNPSWIFDWIDRQQRNGIARERLLEALFQWVQEKSSTLALAVICRVFSSEASRAEFAQLEEVAAGISDHAAIMEGTKFDVFHRTLA